MLRKVVVPFLLSVSALGVSLQATAAPISSSLIHATATTNASSVGALSSRSLNWYCEKADSKGKGFRGSMSATLTHFANGVREIKVNSVTIHKLGGQSGGSKANFEAHVKKHNASFASAYSHDNLKQDGSANTLNWRLSTANAWVYPDTLQIKFTFDKSGIDPTCTSNVAI